MKKLIFFLSLNFLSSLTLAAFPSEKIKSVLEAQGSCANFVRLDEQNIYLGFGPYKNAFEEPRSPIPAFMQVAPLDGTAAFYLATHDAAIDVVTDHQTAFVLTYSSIEEWDLVGRSRRAEYATYAINGPLAYKQHAQAFARYGDKLIIAHGRLGLSFFDIKSKRLTNQFRLFAHQGAFESMAMGVTTVGKYAYVVMDNFSMVDEGQQPPFRGLVVVDMEKEKVLAELPGLDAGGTSVVADNKTLIASMGGAPVWKYSLDLGQGQILPKLASQLISFPVPGHPTGKAALDEKYYYTCYLKAPSFPGENGGRYQAIPLALDRHVSNLD